MMATPVTLCAIQDHCPSRPLYMLPNSLMRLGVLGPVRFVRVAIGNSDYPGVSAKRIRNGTESNRGLALDLAAVERAIRPPGPGPADPRLARRRTPWRCEGRRTGAS